MQALAAWRRWMRKSISTTWCSASCRTMKKRDAKSSPPANLIPDETALFRDAVQDVAPLVAPDKITHSRKNPRPIPRKARPEQHTPLDDSLSDHIPLDAEGGDSTSFSRSGLSHQSLRRLRRGYWPIQDKLDLHGHTSDEARAALAAFLNACGEQGMRCVQVIHGKGHSSENREPVLKVKVRHWLMQRHDVLAFCEAKPEEGGSGAVKVLLKVRLS